jgi:multiple sugar transport system permease protein/raffinose/stachyose/melibiose transport system permease protein
MSDYASAERLTSASSRRRRHSRAYRVLTGDAVQTRLFLIPIAVVLLVLFAYPLGKLVYLSFTNFNGYTTHVKFVGFANYTALFSQVSVTTGIVFTLLYAVGTTVLVTVIAIPLAVMLNKRFYGRGLVRAFLYFPAVPSLAILGLVWSFLLSPISEGALNSLLGSVFGVAPVPWLSNVTLARLSVIVVGAWTQVGFQALLYLAYLQVIPKDFYDAAEVDGASHWQRFRFVTVPQLAPAMTVGCILLMVNGLNVYPLPLALTNGGPGYATYTVTEDIVNLGISSSQYGQGAALSLLYLLIVMVILLSMVFLLRRREGRLV